METFATLAIPAILTVAMLRALFLPMKAFCKVLLYSAGGFFCLWLLNTVSGFTGVCFPINAVTVLIAGFCGIPGISILAILAIL